MVLLPASMETGNRKNGGYLRLGICGFGIQGPSRGQIGPNWSRTVQLPRYSSGVYTAEPSELRRKPLWKTEFRTEFSRPWSIYSKRFTGLRFARPTIDILVVVRGFQWHGTRVAHRKRCEPNHKMWTSLRWDCGLRVNLTPERYQTVVRMAHESYHVVRSMVELRY